MRYGLRRILFEENLIRYFFFILYFFFICFSIVLFSFPRLKSIPFVHKYYLRESHKKKWTKKYMQKQKCKGEKWQVRNEDLLEWKKKKE